MLFVVPGHLNLIVLGIKTQTRRPCKVTKTGKIKWFMTPGNLYSAQATRYQKKDESVIIRDLKCWYERLRGISEEDAWGEGKYTSKQFISLWEDMYPNSKKNPFVQCYEFKFIKDNRPILTHFCQKCGLTFRSKEIYRKNDRIYCNDCLCGGRK